MDLILQINENERTAQDWLILGNLMDEKGEKDNAIFMYQKAISTNPKYYKAYYNLANIYLNEERYNIAIENYKEALKLNKDNPYIHYNLACAYIKSNNLFKVYVDGVYKDTIPLDSYVPNWSGFLVNSNNTL